MAWVEGFGVLGRVGVEGIGSFGLGLARFLRTRGVGVVEVNRPNRQHRRRFGKHDTADAEAAARAVQADVATGEPKSADGVVEMMRALRVARRSALKARTQAANQLRALLFTAPEELKAELRGLPTNRLVTVAAHFRPGRCPRNLVGVTKLAMRSIARRHRDLSEEISALDERLEWLAAEAAPALVALKGVGTDTAVSLLIAAGDNPERLRSEAAFAHLSVRRGPGRGLRFGQGQAPSSQPRGQPGGQQGALRAGARTDELGRAHPGLRLEAHGGGQEQAGDRPLPQALRRPRDLPDAHRNANRAVTVALGVLTDIEASMGAGERDEFLRAAWRALVAGEIRAERLVFVDEMGSNTPRSLPSTRGRVRVRGRRPAPRATGARRTS